jgi:hypothetical protein
MQVLRVITTPAYAAVRSVRDAAAFKNRQCFRFHQELVGFNVASATVICGSSRTVIDDTQTLIGLSQPGAPSVVASHTHF